MTLPVNKLIIAQPLNWVIIFLMILFAVLIFEMVGFWVSNGNGCGCGQQH